VSDQALKVAIAGGSIGGLAAGLALSRLAGAEVDIFERNAGAVETRGAGIVVQPELTELIREVGAGPLATTSCRVRRYLDWHGGAGQVQAMPQPFTSWEAVYRSLRGTFPEERYHSGAEVQGFEAAAGAASVDIAGRAPVMAHLLVCADGHQSPSRRRLLPEVLSSYAGYVAWRGTLDEADAPPGMAAGFDEAFTFSEARSGGHMLVYLIPGDGADPTPGKRRLNWVWYVGADGAELARWLTDRDGRRHHASLPQGGAADAVLTELRERARREVHPRLADLVAATPDPFLQAIVDIGVPRTVFGRVALLGDAAFVVRPHTAAAAAKACADALSLARSLKRARSNVDAGLRAWESLQIERGQGLLQYGQALGRRWSKAS
jgi:2-polyprenyl-6-methoxyphenol hydroxylase-like FAD-dependent oxidoreductase